MHIGELAARTGVSARALRHYEDRGVLVPRRDPNGHRVYSDPDITRVLQIKTMIAAGLGTDTIRRYLDCARAGDHGSDDGVVLEMCPDLRAELDAVAARLDAQQQAIGATRQCLSALSAEG